MLIVNHEFVVRKSNTPTKNVKSEIEIMDKYDSALGSILQNEGKIPDFLDAVFGFLYRRYDVVVFHSFYKGLFQVNYYRPHV